MPSGIFDTYYYNRTIRKITTAFGSMFSNITLVKYTQDGKRELERQIVSIEHAGKEKYIERITKDPHLTRSVQIVLPTMSYVLDGIAYDPSRKQVRTQRISAGTSDAATRNLQYTSVPYNFSFSASLYTRNVEDGYQLIEQIIPMFNPDYSLNIIEDDTMGTVRSLPVILDGFNYELNYQGDMDELRMVVWDFKFTVKGNIMGRVTKTPVITMANTNFVISDTYQQGTGITVLVTQTGGSGIYKTGEYVYQGYNFGTASVYAKVVEWDPTINKLYVTEVLGDQEEHGAFKSNVAIIGRDSGANFTLNNYYIPTEIGATISFTPDPPTSNGYTPYGYIVTRT
jgi:hypothetical protein